MDWRAEFDGSLQVKKMMKIEPTISTRQIAEKLGISRQKVERAIAKLQESDSIKRIGPARGGSWIVNE